MSKNYPVLILFTAVLSAFLAPSSHVYAREIVIKNDGAWLSALKTLKPGDTAVFIKGRFTTGSFSYKDKVISINGSATRPITIRGAGRQETTLDGEGSDKVLFFKDCSHLIIENFTITNPSRFADGASKRIKVSPGNLSEGIILGGGENIKIRESLFINIGTRGVFTSYSNGHLKNFTLEKNLFFNVGNDTASGDINMNSGQNWKIENNLFAGNVDGIVLAGTNLGGGLIENNILMNHWQEDNIDFKGHIGDEQTIIRNNVLYNNRVKQTGLTVQNSSRNITIHNNVFYHGAPVAQIWVHGRNHANGIINDPVSDIKINNNVLYGDDTKSGGGIWITEARDRGDAHRPVPIERVEVQNNYVLNHKNKISNNVGRNTKVLNNKYLSLPISREQEFAKMENSILSIIQDTFSSTVIRQAFEEAQVPYQWKVPNKNLKASPPHSKPLTPLPKISQAFEYHLYPTFARKPVRMSG